MEDVKVIELLMHLEEKFKLLNEMKYLSMKQLECLDQDRMDIFEELLNYKDEIIEQVDLVNSQFYELFGKFKKGLGISDLSELQGAQYEYVSELVLSIRRIETILEELQELNQLNIERANQVMDTYRTDLKKVKDGRKMRSIYGIVNEDGVILDTKQ